MRRFSKGKRMSIVLAIAMIITLLSAVAFAGTGTVQYPLYAGQDEFVGYVNVSNDADNLYVTFEITVNEPWVYDLEILETNVHVGTSLDDFPLVGRWGNPSIGNFDYSNSLHAYTIDLGDWTAGDTLLIGAHAVIGGQIGVETNCDIVCTPYEETAWAAECEGGTRFSTSNDNGNWATYISYTLK